MPLGSTQVVDTFAEAFRARYCRVVVSAVDAYWLDAALREFCGYGSSVIGCDAEMGIERHLAEIDSPDGRPAAEVLAFGFSGEGLQRALTNRVGQCLMTCPTTAVFDGLPQATERLAIGRHIRFFGDGFQKSKQVDGQRYWRIPVMDGEFVVAESIGVDKGVAGGNIIILGTSQTATLAAARRSVESIAQMPGVVTPFPGGVVRSGSKVGSRNKGLVASTNDAFCPTLRGRVVSDLPEGAECAYEIVVNGIDELHVAQAMRTMLAAVAGEGVLAISAGNYGGKLGKFHIRLHDLL